MRLSIVIPTLDEGSRIDATLRALQPLRGDGHEVVVVDGGSEDDTLAMARPLADRVMQSPRGRAVQMNVGASLASGDVLLFLHADTLLHERAVPAIASALARGRRWGRFDVRIQGASGLLPIVGALMNLRSRASGIATGDQGIFVAREVFHRAGGFPSIPLMEDVALSRTLLRVAGRPACLSEKISTSGRRWDAHGQWRTIAMMWRLRFAYWCGVDPAMLAGRYGLRNAAPLPLLIVFAKEPRAGHAKRRLGATLGDEAAVRVHRELVERTLSVACAARAAGVVHDAELWCDGDPDAEAFRDWAARFGVSVQRQGGGDLGERMQDALRRTLDDGRPGILVGTDCPLLDVPYLSAAAASLANHDAVFGPAEDGGYVLVGLSRRVPAFDDIAWGTDSVMSATRDRLVRHAARWCELPTLWDVDVERDYARWRELAPVPAG